jgi:hypothetical protein
MSVVSVMMAMVNGWSAGVGYLRRSKLFRAFSAFRKNVSTTASFH